MLSAITSALSLGSSYLSPKSPSTTPIITTTTTISLQKTLPSFPPEIISLIIQHFLPDHSPSNSWERLPPLLLLSRINLMFYEAARIEIFRFIWLSNGGENLKSVITGLKGFKGEGWKLNCARVKFIDLNQDSTSDVEDKIREPVLELLESAINLQEIWVYKADEIMFNVLNKLPYLKSLHIHGHKTSCLPINPILFTSVNHVSLCHWFKSTTLFAPFLNSTNLPNLKSLQLIEVNIGSKNFLTNCQDFGKGLEYLELIDCTGEQLFLKTCIELKHLAIAYYHVNFPSNLLEQIYDSLLTCHLPTTQFFYLVQATLTSNKKLSKTTIFYTSSIGLQLLTDEEMTLLKKQCIERQVKWIEEETTGVRVNRWEGLRRGKIE